MIDVLSFPFRVGLDGQIAKSEQNSDTQIGEELAMLITTTVGERIMAPGFGMTDFVYSVIDDAELNLKVKIFDIPARIISVSTVYPKDTVQNVTIEFDTNIRKDRG